MAQPVPEDAPGDRGPVATHPFSMNAPSAQPVNLVRCTLTLWLLACASTAAAQSTGELWGNLTIDWLARERLTFTADVEPKAQTTAITRQQRYSNVDVWPTVEFAAAGWIDLHGEFLAGYTNEQDGSSTTELTERIGARLHFLS